MDLTPKPPTPCWSLLNCCRPSASSKLTVRNQELQKEISELKIRNQELEANIASISEENDKYVLRLVKDKKKKTERRATNRSKVSLVNRNKLQINPPI
mmetsp:Transcript_20979/g.37621  ORF Transcript_20979/g.37621 Transcript_20979/m.37621 type:complete len:98 (-) Transcript_20979:538-831(-)